MHEAHMASPKLECASKNAFSLVHAVPVSPCNPLSPCPRPLATSRHSSSLRGPPWGHTSPPLATDEWPNRHIPRKFISRRSCHPTLASRPPRTCAIDVSRWPTWLSGRVQKPGSMSWNDQRAARPRRRRRARPLARICTSFLFAVFNHSIYNHAAGFYFSCPSWDLQPPMYGRLDLFGLALD
jgi:hypothetical protein